ncbi:hypothetical protein N7520_000271 [Penicillium odoratum]|uniref:uncharacterized protein n=1 Tax=Penicillium odoratum TaxID=1167516 RepID=UPI00254895CB|nr:uncharacterized protein N7520_000271 [Penicillium odoratum]KAJ5777025.1 hypothetical protein N7520_000271 [Penicillium odoratum]
MSTPQHDVPASSPESSAEITSPKASPTTKTGRKLPAWLDHFNARDLKVLFRCSVAAWIASLLIVISPSLETIGTATFFATLVLFMVPPAGIVFIFILGALTLIVGMAIGWAWGVIAMKAALAARPAAETQAKLQALGKLAYSEANSTGQSVAVVEELLIFNGFMLDARVSAVYICLICVMVYFLARLRAKNPKFTLTAIFGMIIMDIPLTIGPLLSSFDGTLAKTLVEPAAIGIGIGLACQVLLFPKSTSSTVLDGFEGLTRLLKGPLNVAVAGLIEKEPLALADLLSLKMKAIDTYKKIMPALGFLPLDFSVGRWGADDIKSLKDPLRQASLTSLSLLEFFIARIGGEEKVEKLRSISTDKDDFSNDAIDEKRPRSAGMRQLMESVRLVRAFQSPEHESLRLEMIEAMRITSEKILPACQEAVSVVADALHAVNSGRWFGRATKQSMDELTERVRSALEILKAERLAFASEFTEKLIQTNADIFDQSGKLKDLEDSSISRVRALTVAMVFQEHLLGVAGAWEQVLDQLVPLMTERQKTRLWLPNGLRYAVDWVLRQNSVAPVNVAQSSDADPEAVEAHSKAAHQSLRMSRGYRVKQRSGLGRAIIGTHHWLGNAEGMFALRMVVVTVALTIPAVIPSSAGFYYREKGLWALIMAQTSLVVYMPDFILALVSRTIGTVLGGVAGLVAWYIGSGNGNGNPYGLAAVLAVTLPMFMWGRIFFPPILLQAAIMGCATFILVVGYSYDDTHIAAYGNPGHGYTVFWRRLVLVLIGSAAALIVQILPSPPSASRHICKSLSNTIRSLSDHYALLLSCWGQPDREEGLVAQELAFNVAGTLSTLDGPIALLRLEFSGSPFDSERLAQVKNLCQDLNQNLARLLFLSASLPEHFQNRLATHSGLLDHRNIGEIMAVLGVVEQALKTGDALPEVLPTPLLKRSFEFWQKHQGELTLTTDLIRDDDYRKFCVAISSYLKFLAAVDDLVLVMKGTLGESHIPLARLPARNSEAITNIPNSSMVFYHSFLRPLDYFTSRNVPGIIASYGASAVLVFGAMESPLAQPRALIFGHFFSALIGICVTKLFSLMPDQARFESLRWLAASLSTSIAIVVMQLTGTTHPPAGATALLPATDDAVWDLSWYFLPVVLLSSTMLMCCALLLNNLQRRYPVFWIAPSPPPKPTEPKSAPRPSDASSLQGDVPKNSV